MLRACNANLDDLRKMLGDFIRDNTPVVPGTADVDTQPTLGFQRVIQRAIMHVQSSSNGKKEVNGANVLVAIFGEKDSHAVYFLHQQGVTRLDVVNYISHGVRKNTQQEPAKQTEGAEETRGDPAQTRESPLELYTQNLNLEASAGRIDPLIGREEEIDRVIQVLCRRRKNNPLLVGEAGVGKTAIAEGLAWRITQKTVPDVLQDAVVSIRNGRYVVPVRAEYRGEVGGVIHDVSSTGATVFVEPTSVVEANARIMQLRAQEQEEITRILSSFSAQVASLEPQFSYSYDAMLQIDLLLAKARLAVEQNAFMPAVSDTTRFKLCKARHPLIDKKKVVPVDIALGEEYDTLVITGPNTGGKTVTLKTAGLLNAMAQYGFLIPANEHSTVCHFEEYLVDIGDEQSIEQSLSTFSGHMKRITGILELAGPGTLTLLDELGAGTDPAEGAALAVSLLE